MALVQLREFCQARSGDKSDSADISLFAPTREIYEILCEQVTSARVLDHYQGYARGPVHRYEVPNVLALKFVVHGALGGGASSSLRSDNLGKAYGSNLLRLEVEVPEDVLRRTPVIGRPPESKDR